MSEKILTIQELQQQFMQLADQFDHESEPIFITRDSQTVMVLMSSTTYNAMKQRIQSLYEQVESLEETLEILQDEDTINAFRQGVAGMEAGRVHPIEEVFKELGWE